MDRSPHRLLIAVAGLTTLAWLDIGDEGVKRMAPLTQLKHLRLNNTTIKDPKCFEALVSLESLDLGDAYVLDNSLAPLAAKYDFRAALTIAERDVPGTRQSRSSSSCTGGSR